MSARSRLRDLSASATKQQNLNVWYALRSLSWSYDGETSSSCTRRASKYRALGGTALARASSRENISSWSTSEVEDEDEEAGWREEGSNGGRGGCVKAVSQVKSTHECQRGRSRGCKCTPLFFIVGALHPLFCQR